MIKRLFDVVCSGLGLLALLPLLALIAIAIKLDSPGPVFSARNASARTACHFASTSCAA